jgi:flavin reductase (DIM6/NTAB) family NADH-FMN oxidoreductase RutF
MIKETGCFVVNLAGKECQECLTILEATANATETTCRNDVRMADGVKVNAPILLDCPVNIECT